MSYLVPGTGTAMTSGDLRVEKEKHVSFKDLDDLPEEEEEIGASAYSPLGRVVEFRAWYRQIPVRGYLGGRQNLETVRPTV